MVIALLIILLPLSAIGHSGGTDYQGGHFNRRTGEYHFHHGMGPHQHSNGVCPFYTGTRFTHTKSDSLKLENDSKPKPSFYDRHPLLTIMGVIVLGLCIAHAYALIRDNIKRKS